MDSYCVEYPALREVLLTYQRRPDLQAAFPEFSAGHFDGLLRWALSFGVNEDPAIAELSSEIASLSEKLAHRKQAVRAFVKPKKVHVVALATFPQSFRRCAQSLHEALVRFNIPTEYHDEVGATELSSLSYTPADEVVHVVGQGPIGGLLRSKARNWVITIHGAAPFAMPPELHSPPGQDLEELRTNAARISRVICPTFSARREIAIAYGIPESRIEPIPHFFDFDVFRPDSPRYQSSQPYFLVVSNYQPVKNFSAVFEAFNLFISKQGHDLPQLLIASELSPALAQVMREAVARWPRLERRVKVLGHVEQLAPLYRGALALVSMSHRESFGMPYIEAALCGVPVVGPVKSTRAAAWGAQATRELLGGAAMLVRPEHPEDLAAAMELLFSNEGQRSAAGKKCRHRALEYVDSAFLMRRYLHVYGKVLERSL